MFVSMKLEAIKGIYITNFVLRLVTVVPRAGAEPVRRLQATRAGGDEHASIGGGEERVEISSCFKMHFVGGVSMTLMA